MDPSLWIVNTTYGRSRKTEPRVREGVNRLRQQVEYKSTNSEMLEFPEAMCKGRESTHRLWGYGDPSNSGPH